MNDNLKTNVHYNFFKTYEKLYSMISFTLKQDGGKKEIKLDYITLKRNNS